MTPIRGHQREDSLTSFSQDDFRRNVSYYSLDLDNIEYQQPSDSVVSVAELTEELQATKVKVNEKVRAFVKEFDLDSPTVGFSQSYPPSVHLSSRIMTYELIARLARSILAAVTDNLIKGEAAVYFSSHVKSCRTTFLTLCPFRASRQKSMMKFTRKCQDQWKMLNFVKC